MTEKPSHAGHRERLRERFLKGGAEAMPDYEMLELVLFAAVPRRDTKPLAKALIARFGSFAEVIAAKRERLMEVEGVGEAVVNQLKIVEAAAQRLAKGKFLGRPALSSWTRFWIIAWRRWRAARPSNFACCFWTARMCWSPMKCRARARWTTPLSIRARLCGARWSMALAPLSWCIIISYPLSIMLENARTL
jgi:hypothetical protein